jgi:Tfp pilus assembly protein PilV
MRLHLARSTRGFALIQVLVALAISFVVGAGLLSLTTNLFQVQQTAVQRNA